MVFIKNKVNKLKLAAAMLLGIILPVHAQGVDPWLADHFNKEIMKSREYNQRMKQEMQQTRELRIREKAVQAQIKKYRKTPYYYAIAYDFSNKNRLVGRGGYQSEQFVSDEVMKECKNHPLADCRMLKTFSNNCAIVVSAIPEPRTPDDIFIGVDKNDTEAGRQAMKACQAVHGTSKDRCFFSGYQTGKGKSGTAFCSGYDYGVYGY